MVNDDLTAAALNVNAGVRNCNAERVNGSAIAQVNYRRELNHSSFTEVEFYYIGGGGTCSNF